jgi:hypothetical protein
MLDGSTSKRPEDTGSYMLLLLPLFCTVPKHPETPCEHMPVTRTGTQ